MAYGHTGASDERIKTNIKTIENALENLPAFVQYKMNEMK
jgi:hypothetical protein